MKIVKKIVIAAVFAVLVTTSVQALRASEADWSTIVTIDRQMEVPGVVLAPGSYLFQVLPNTGSRDIVLIYSADKKKLFGMIRGVPAYRVITSVEPTFNFEERADGAPQALQSWFYPDNHSGVQFLYHHTKNVQTTKATTSPVVTAWAVR